MTKVKIEHTQVFGFHTAVRGMRNPMDSWDKMDSRCNICSYPPAMYSVENFILGPNDLKLCKKLIKAGPEHRKFMRQIQIWMDITIPRRTWQELDTYKIATVRNSCSTMHKLGHRDLTADDFLDGVVLSQTLTQLNNAGFFYREKMPYNVGRWGILTGYRIVDFMKKILPEGFLQKATYTMNYETARNMYLQRKSHRLPEWTVICDWIKSLPYMKEFLDA